MPKQKFQNCVYQQHASQQKVKKKLTLIWKLVTDQCSLHIYSE